jgi:hypothetical protein
MLSIPEEITTLGKAIRWARQQRGWTVATAFTLSPGIWFHATEHDGHPGWHGFLRNGELVSC